MQGIIPHPVTTHTLANGLKLIFMPVPANGLVAYWSIVRTGSGQEYEAGRSGFAHFFEHMMFRGTERYPAQAYQDIFTRIGADANAFTTDDLTAYHASLATEDLPQVIELESDRFKYLAYPEEAFRTEAGAVYGEYRKSRAEPLFALYEPLIASAFTVHPYGHTTLGYERDIAAMPDMYAYSREFFARHYRPDNTTIFIVGDFDMARTLALLETHYSDWTAGYVPPEVPTEPLQHDERRVDVAYEGHTLPLVWLAYKIGRFDPGKPLRAAADLVAELVFGPTSEVYKQLVLDEQVVEFLHAGADMNRDPGLLNIYARIKDPAEIERVLDSLDVAIKRSREAPPVPARLEALKARQRYAFLMDLETPDAIAEQLARPIAVGGDLDAIETLYATWNALTPEAVHEAANACFVQDRRTLGVLQ